MKRNIQMWPLEVFPEVSVPTATATPFSKLDRCSVASRGGRGVGTTDRGPGPDYVAYVLIFLDIFSLSILQINHFRPSPRNSATDRQSFRFSAYLKTLSQSALAYWGRRGLFFFYRGLNPLSAALQVPAFVGNVQPSF